MFSSLESSRHKDEKASRAMLRRVSVTKLGTEPSFLGVRSEHLNPVTASDASFWRKINRRERGVFLLPHNMSNCLAPDGRQVRPLKSISHFWGDHCEALVSVLDEKRYLYCCVVVRKTQN